VLTSRMPGRDTSPRAVCWKSARTVRRALAGDRVWSAGLRRRPKGCDGTHLRPVATAPAFDSTAPRCVDGHARLPYRSAPALHAGNRLPLAP
jgi:hypothetical protein